MTKERVAGIGDSYKRIVMRYRYATEHAASEGDITVKELCDSHEALRARAEKAEKERDEARQDVALKDAAVDLLANERDAARAKLAKAVGALTRIKRHMEIVGGTMRRQSAVVVMVDVALAEIGEKP
jgi:hypothetical protein